MAEKDRKDGIEVIEKAIMFATQAHEGQVRKGTDRPYIVHPLEVGRIVASMTEDGRSSVRQFCMIQLKTAKKLRKK